VALRVGKHRVTYQPTSGLAASAANMKLRIDGTPVTLPSNPINLGGGNMVAGATSGEGLNINISDGTSLTVTPLFWATEGYWYLDVHVNRTPAREGIVGPVLAGDWLPRAPDGTSFGPKPASLHDRHVVLNQKFANAWRVGNTTSLFDYEVGTSTANFTDLNWPTESGLACRTKLPSNPPLKRMQPELAKTVCRGIKDKAILANCLFDVTVMGDRGVAKGYLHSDGLKATEAHPAQPNKPAPSQ